jgi:hypothetical protein
MMTDVVLAEPIDQIDGTTANTFNETDTRLATLIELLMKDQTSVDELARGATNQREMIPRFLAIGLSGYLAYGIALSVLLGVAHVWPQLTAVSVWLNDPSAPLAHFAWTANSTWWQPWFDGSAIRLVAAFSLGMIGSVGICLPSFYFYGLLAGVRTSMLHVTLIALKGMASGAIALVGILPVYFAIALGLIVFETPRWTIEIFCCIGFALPFIAGLWGTRSLYLAFVDLADMMRNERRCERLCFLRRLLVSWSLCFTAVTPVLIYTLWEYLG